MNKIFKPTFIIRFLAMFVLLLIQVHAMPKVSGFASVEGKGLKTTTGGAGGKEVIAKNQSDLEKYAKSNEPLVIKIDGSITITPLGKEVSVKSNKSFIGIGSKAEIVKGGFNLSGVSNVIFHNLTIRDSYLEGDWDGKKNDFDGIQMDNCHHIWIDHCHFSRAGDGLIDSRKNTTFVTISWCILSDHNKALGIGWTSDVSTAVTIHHTWFKKIAQRNPSADNVKHCHLFNNFMEDLNLRDWSYGNWCRGGTHMIIENSVYHRVIHPHFVRNPTVPTNFTGALKVTNPLYDDKCTGQKVMSEGTVNFDPKDFYEYTLHPVEKVEELLRSCAGPQDNFNCEDMKTSSKSISRLIKNRISICTIGNSTVLMNFFSESPRSFSIYSLNGTRQYHRTGNIGRSHRWKASKNGIYQLRLLSQDGQTSISNILITH